MNIEHIAIPMDELELFKDEDVNQHYLVQTLIYSTKVTSHNNNHKAKCLLIITKTNLWLEQEGNKKKKRLLGLKWIKQIIKAEEHPEMVILTEQTQDNLRISTANQQRSSNIISALSFYFKYLSKEKKSLRVYLIKQNSLLYFQRTVKEKKSGPRLSLTRYKNTEVDYVEPNESPDIFGKLVIHKMILSRQLYVEGQYLMHLAVINEHQYYHCHTLTKTEEMIKTLTEHKNMQNVQKMQYAKQLEYKIQILFEYLPSLKPRTLKITDMFEQLYRLYDYVKQESKDGFITPHMLLRSSEDSKKIILREFRYKFLIFDYEYNAFIYQKIYKQKTEEDYIVNKMFNLGLILYYYLFGRNPFEHQDLEFVQYLKYNMKEVPFPKSIHINFSKKVQFFIEKCIVGEFKNKEDITNDPWIQLNKIQI